MHPGAGSAACSGLPAPTRPSTAPRAAAALTCRAAAAAAEGAVVRSKSERSTARRRRKQGRSAETPPDPSDDAPGRQEGINTSSSLWALREPEAPPLEEYEDRADRTLEASSSGRGADTAQSNEQEQQAWAQTQSFAGEGASETRGDSNNVEAVNDRNGSHEQQAAGEVDTVADASGRASAEGSRWDVRTVGAGTGVEPIEPEVFEAAASEADWRDERRGTQVHDAEFSVSVASPEEAARAAEERWLEEEEAAMQEEARRRLSRKAEILLELLAAGDAVEARIKAHGAEVDDLMLQLLQRRIEAAERLSQAEGLIDAMRVLFRRLQVEAARAAATPAQRLLDDALQILAGTAQMDYQARKQEVADRLTAAFTPPSSRAVDIFATAQALAEGETVGLDDMYSEHVPPGTFVTEAQQLLDESLKVNAALQRALVEHDWTGGDDRRTAVETELRDRTEASADLQTVLTLAVSVQGA